MRVPLVLASCAAALAVAASLPPSSTAQEPPLDGDAAERPHVLIAIVPQRSSPRLGLLGKLERRGMTLGLLSPTLGGFTRRQMMLDVSQGARISSRAYDERVPRFDLELLDGGRGRMLEWPAVAKRARDAPGDVVPGLLAQSVVDAGLRVAYVGAPAPEQVEAAAAADRDGRIGRVALAGEEKIAALVGASMRDHELVVARLPFGSAGIATLDAVLAARAPTDLVVVLRAPPGIPLQLVPAGLVGGGFGSGVLRSSTTRRAGLAAMTDLAPTVLRHLGIPVPSEMEGKQLETAPGDAADLHRLADRLDVVVDRRGPVLNAAVMALVLLVGGLTLGWGTPGLRLALRVTLLAALWMPGLALLTAALRPVGWVEIALITLGSLALGLVTDRLAPWPYGPGVPAAIVMAVYAVDLASNSTLVGLSLAGPNPKGGARFFGIGNELEILLGVTVLIGAGALVARTSGGRGARALVLACLVAGVVIGAGRLGADVGGVITLGAGAGGGALAMLAAGGGLSRRAIAVAVSAPFAAVVALVAIDLATGGGAHLTSSVIEAERPSELLDVIERRIRISFAGLSGQYSVSFALAVITLVAGVRWRRRLLEPAASAPGLRAGIVGAFAATVVGSAANDSGPVMFMTGTLLLLLAIGYVQGRPEADRTTLALARSPEIGRATEDWPGGRAV